MGVMSDDSAIKVAEIHNQALKGLYGFNSARAAFRIVYNLIGKRQFCRIN